MTGRATDEHTSRRADAQARRGKKLTFCEFSVVLKVWRIRPLKTVATRVLNLLKVQRTVTEATADLGFTGVRTLRPRVETRGTEGYGRDRAHRPRARRARSCGATLAPTMHMRARAALRFRSHPHTGCRAPRPSARPSRRPRGRLRASCSARPPRAMLVHPHSSRIALLTASYRALAGTMSTCVYQLSERGALAVAAGRRVQTRSGIYIGRQPRLLPIPPMTAFNRRRCIARAVRGARR
jgi:hypothetical protein